MSDDSLTALVLRENYAEWTSLQRRKHRMEIVQQKSVEIQLPEGVEDHHSQEAASHLKTLLPVVKGRLGIAIPANRVLMRVAELPSTDREELEGMAELQVDKFSPFPSDQMSFSVEVLAQREDSSRVLIAAVQHAYIDTLGEFLLMTGMYPQSVDVDVLGWWSLLKSAGRVAQEGQEVLVINDGECAQLFVIRDGVPIVIRAMDAALDPHSETAAEEISDEVEYTLMTLEGTWGAIDTSLITIWARGSVAAELVESLSSVSGVDVKTGNLDDLPPLSEGLSQRMASTETDCMDLAPASWKQSIQSRKYQRQAVTIAATAFGLWALLMGGLWFWSSYQKSALADAQNEILRLQNEVTEVRELRSQVESLKQYADRQFSGLECLLEISTLLPASVDISSFTYNKESQVNLRGEADTDRPINDFIGSLEKSALFTSVRTEAINTRTRNGQTRSLFRVIMMLPTTEEEPES